MPWEAFTAALAALPEGQLWRHNVSGDLPGASDTLDAEKCEALTAANKGKRGFTYSHYPLTGHNLDVLSRMNADGFTVNVSHNSPQEALAAVHGLPAVTIVPIDFWQGEKRQGRIVRCPAETSDKISCATCQLCQRRDRNDIVGFSVHGTRKKNAEIIAMG